MVTAVGAVRIHAHSGKLDGSGAFGFNDPTAMSKRGARNPKPSETGLAWAERLAVTRRVVSCCIGLPFHMHLRCSRTYSSAGHVRLDTVARPIVGCEGFSLISMVKQPGFIWLLVACSGGPALDACANEWRPGLACRLESSMGPSCVHVFETVPGMFPWARMRSGQTGATQNRFGGWLGWRIDKVGHY